jgi:hypothetical protein
MHLRSHISLLVAAALLFAAFPSPSKAQTDTSGIPAPTTWAGEWTATDGKRTISLHLGEMLEFRLREQEEKGWSAQTIRCLYEVRESRLKVLGCTHLKIVRSGIDFSDEMLQEARSSFDGQVEYDGQTLTMTTDINPNAEEASSINDWVGKMLSSMRRRGDHIVIGTDDTLILSRPADGDS